MVDIFDYCEINYPYFCDELEKEKTEIVFTACVSRHGKEEHYIVKPVLRERE